MKIGLLLPQGYFNEFEGWQPVAAWERILEVARLGERLGFDALWTGEHVLAKWDPEGMMFDCVTLHTAVAAAVPRVDIGFGVINSTFRNPAMTAKMASTLDTISGGRLILGLGCGFKPSEASAFGAPFPDMKERLAILGEHFEIISRMTRRDEAPFTFEGQHARVENVVNAPADRRRRPRAAGDRRPRQERDHAARREVLRRDQHRPAGRVAGRGDGRPGRPLRRDRARPGDAGRRDRHEPGLALSRPPRNGRQRLMKKEDLPAIMPYDFDNLLPRADEMAQWVELGIDSIICGVPGLVDTDEGVYELLDDLRAAGIAPTPAAASA